MCRRREERGIRYLCGGPRCVVVHLVVGSHADQTGHISCREVPGDRPFHTYRSERRLECKRVIRQPAPAGQTHESRPNRVTMRVLRASRASPSTLSRRAKTPPDQGFRVVGATGIEPVTSAV